MTCSEDRVSVAVVSYNTRDLLLDCLGSIAKSAAGDNLDIIVVDNNSSDGSDEAVRRFFPQATLIRNPQNSGFGRACNQAIAATSSPYILLLNSDASLDREALDALSDCMRNDPRCGAAGCRVLDSSGVPVINTRHFLNPINQALELLGIRISSRVLTRSQAPRLNQSNQDCSIEWIDGACLMLRRTAIEDVGLFDERFFMYSEDEDLCFRLKQRGWSICFTALGSVRHRGGGSAAQNRVESLVSYYSSQIEFLRKNRSSFSASLYVWIIRGILWVKRFFKRPSRMAGFEATADEMIQALRHAMRAPPRRGGIE
jgi:N-acetylglucosaminyl-diphospho-decaprenol L-rhamnosyltransferase